MPTADAYRTIASRLESARDSVLSLLRPFHTTGAVSPFPVAGGGGSLERTVATTLAVTSANVDAIAAELAEQVGEARHRAVVCDRYTEAVRRYHRSNDPRRTFPPKPASWADHG